MASALFRLSSDGGSTYLDPGVALADSNALAYNGAGSYSIKAALDSTTGVGSVTWTIHSADDEHIGSLPTVTTAVDKSCTFSVPKQGGAWLLRCQVNSGLDREGTIDPELTKALAIKVLTEAGQQVIAIGETTEAGAYGWVKAVNDAVRATGGASEGAMVIYREGGSAGGSTYVTFAEAVAAAQEVDGEVDLLISLEDDPPEFPAGTYNLDRRIRVRAFGVGADELPAEVAIEDGAELQNAVFFENIKFVGEVSQPLFTAPDGHPHHLTFVRCYRDSTGDSAGLVSLANGTNKFWFVDTEIYQDSTTFCTLAAAKHVTAVLEGKSYVNAEAFNGGGVGTLNVHVGAGATWEGVAGSVGSLTRTDGAVVSLGQATSAISVNNQQITSLATPTADTHATNRGYTNGLVGPWRAYGISGQVSADTTTWTTIGTVRLDPSALPAPTGKTKGYTLRADLEVAEASASTVTTELRLIDASLTSLGSVTTTLGGASSFPEHKSTTLTAGGSNGQVRSTATSYLVQYRRQGGSTGDRCICHAAYIEVVWS